MQLPVTLRLRSSPTLAVALILAHAAMAFGAVMAELPGTVLTPLVAIVALSLAISLLRHVFRHPVVALTLRADGALEVLCRDGSSRCADVRAQTTTFSWLVVLLLRIGRRTVALSLPRDALGGEGHRRLRLWLRWKASAAV